MSEVVKKMAALAMIRIDECDMERYSLAMDKIMKRLEIIKLLQIEDNTLPMYNSTSAHQDMNLRDDVVGIKPHKDEILQCAPKSDDDYILVPRVVE